MNEEIYISKQQYEKLVSELRKLKEEERKKTTERLKMAISYGDLSENAEYEEAQIAKESLEIRILKLEKILKSAKIINLTKSKNKILPETSFEVLNITNNKKYTFRLVGLGEANPNEGKISTESALGKGFLNKKVGDVVKIKTPKGINVYKIIRIID